jgi:hypothetical protein
MGLLLLQPVKREIAALCTIFSFWREFYKYILMKCVISCIFKNVSHLNDFLLKPMLLSCGLRHRVLEAVTNVSEQHITRTSIYPIV